MQITNILIQAGTSIGIGVFLILMLIIIVIGYNVDIFDRNIDAILSMIYILLAPFFEEVFFRAPLLFFNSLSIYSIITSIIISCHFGYIHRNNKEKWLKRVKKDTKVSIYSKASTVCITGSLGIILSIITIKTQSLFYPVIIHFVYNLTILIVAAIIATYKIRKQSK